MPTLHVSEAPAALHDLIRHRWSPRAFSDRPIAPEDLRSLLEAARWSASSYNEQPWRFVVGTRDHQAAWDRLFQLLMPFNQVWAQNAPVLLLTLAKQTFSHNQSPNYYALHDAGQALAQLLLQASALGVQGHAMGGFDHAKAREVLQIPDDYAIGAMVALGYPGQPEQLEEPLRQREIAERTRKPLGEIAFSGDWGKPLTF